jgi:hypothetical protein
MERLANELIDKILSFLDDDSLNVAERVCVAWSRIIVAKVWFPRIRQYVQHVSML